MTVGVFPPPRGAEAQPALSVSKSFSGKPLLGGTATVSITVTNNGDQRGYNLSLTDVFSSSRLDPEGRVTFVSASDSNGNLPPSSVSADPTTGDLTVSFDNFRDLEPTESTTIDITVSLAGDATWEVGDPLIDNVTAQVNDLPDGSGTWRQGTVSASTEGIPITIVTKSANQSTGVGQATGTLDRALHLQHRGAEQLRGRDGEHRGHRHHPRRGGIPGHRLRSRTDQRGAGQRQRHNHPYLERRYPGGLRELDGHL
ncbi:MAG: hypothetical protein ACUVRX_11230 [Actinomycetota bacterium]